MCKSKMSFIGKTIIVYADINNNMFPTPDKWYDLLIENVEAAPRAFICPEAFKAGDKEPCHYAMNPNCSPNSPNDVVLLFETKGEWNQSGEADLLNLNHFEGCNLLFNDGHVEWVETEDVGKLNWGQKNNQQD